MNKKTVKTRVITVTHPIYKDIILFRATVTIDYDADLVDEIKGIHINYTLKKPKTRGKALEA